MENSCSSFWDRGLSLSAESAARLCQSTKITFHHDDNGINNSIIGRQDNADESAYSTTTVSISDTISSGLIVTSSNITSTFSTTSRMTTPSLLNIHNTGSLATTSPYYRRVHEGSLSATRSGISGFFNTSASMSQNTSYGLDEGFNRAVKYLDYISSTSKLSLSALPPHRTSHPSSRCTPRW